MFRKLRLAFLLKEYATYPLEDLTNSTEKLRKRLGGLRLSQALNCLLEKDFDGWLRILLEYYDKTYLFGISQRNLENIHKLYFEKMNFEEMAERVMNYEL